MVLWGRFGEKGVTEGGLSEMDDALKMLRAAAMEFLLRLLVGISSRGEKSLREDTDCGVPTRPRGEAA
jgi:hypothetical protein